jgi:hypothetical protein
LGRLPGGADALQTEDVYKERIARFLELAEAAQSAAERASSIMLKVTYAKLASQWVELAQTAARTIAVTHQPRDLLGESEPLKTHDPRMH